MLSYNDFLNSLISPISLFISSIFSVANTLIHNYIFVTILGLSLFISFVWFVFYIFYNYINSKISYYDYKYDRYKSYELYKETQYKYLNKHRNDEYSYLYNQNILKQQVLNGIYRRHSNLVFDNFKLYKDIIKQYNYKLNKSSGKYIYDSETNSYYSLDTGEVV